MKSTLLFSSVLLVASAVPALLAGCASRQQAQSQHVPEAEFARYAQKYPQMGKYAKQGFSKDGLYSLRYDAPEDQIFSQWIDKVHARRVEVNAMHIPASEKQRLILTYIRDNQTRYINAANAAGIQAQQEEKRLGHSPFAQ